MAKHLDKASFSIPAELPIAFSDWREYRDYLIENLLTDEEIKASFRDICSRMDVRYAKIGNKERMYKAQMSAVLTNDFHFVKINNWVKSPEVNSWRKFQRGETHINNLKNRYILEAAGTADK